MLNKILNKIPLLFLIILSFSVNYYYGSRGVLSIDTFSHFDSTYKLMNGIVEFRDFWNISGAVIDYLQLPFFYLFGVNWTSYILQSSLFNCLITLCTFFFLNSLGLKKNYTLFYSICFSILANHSMGSAFIDHYSTFFSLMGLYCFSFAIREDNFYYWFLLPILFFLAFLSKQTPATYVIITTSLSILIYSITFKKISFIKPLILSSTLCIATLIIFLFSNDISLSNFIIQYLLFPQTIGSERFTSFNLDFYNTILNFKFIYIVLAFLIFVLVKNRKMISKQSRHLLIINFSLLLFIISLIFHQIYTKNFIFIFFLIPLVAAVAHSQLTNEFKNKRYLVIFVILLTVFTTLKYHHRFNVERKMLNLEKMNLDDSIDAGVISKKLSGLKWITYGKFSPKEEIKLIKESLNIIDKDQNEILLLTSYNFFSSVLEKNLYTPARWPTDLVSNPSKQNKFYEDYVFFVRELINKKNIKSIYITLPSTQTNVSDLIEDSCITKKIKNEILLHFEIKENC